MSSAKLLDRTFHALADQTRRGLLEMLSKGPCTTGTLVEAFPHLSRVGVMKHLGVLESAGLVSVRRDGRERWNTMERDPLKASDDWMARHVERRRDMMMRLKAVAEERNNG